jgi:uncharacterized damage-inducible protein DinB
MDLLLWNLQPAPGRKNWHGGPSPVGAVRGVDAEQAAWRPTPRRKSIWELALHMAAWAGEVTRRLGGSPPGEPAEGDWPAMPERTDESTWIAARLRLAEAHAELTGTVAARQSLTDLEAHTVNGLVQHDAYHAGQVSLLRKLLRENPP